MKLEKVLGPYEFQVIISRKHIGLGFGSYNHFIAIDIATFEGPTLHVFLDKPPTFKELFLGA